MRNAFRSIFDFLRGQDLVRGLQRVVEIIGDIFTFADTNFEFLGTFSEYSKFFHKSGYEDSNLD